MVANRVNEGRGRSHLALGLALAGIVVAVGLAYWLLQPREPNITGYVHPAAPHQTHQAGGEDCRQENLIKLRGTQSKIEQERCADAKDADKSNAELLEYSARSANAAEQAVLISDYQARVFFSQALVTFCALIAAVAAALYAKRAVDQAAISAGAAVRALKIAQDTHAAENRPWVQVDNLRICGDMAIHAGQSAIPATFDMINKGNAPATDILPYWRVIPNSKQMEIADQIDFLITSYQNVKNASIGRHIPEQILFPDQPRTRHVEMDFQISDVAEPLGTSRWIISALAILVVCYKSPHDDKPKWSVCTYTLHVDKAAYVIDNLKDIPATIERSRLELTPWFNGWTAG